ncbi:MAG: hypothetical protein ILA39_03055 [Bacteroidaceae bacterium]|nr:hypothetical protein [Bacteroidaceae bacterium]
MWEFSIFLWALFLALLVFGWKMLLLILFLSILAGIADYQVLQNRRKKQYEEAREKERSRLKLKKNAKIHAILASIAASKQAELKEKSNDIQSKLADLEAEIDKLSHEIKGANATDSPSNTDEAQPAEQIERLSQKLSALKAEYQHLQEQ